MALIKKQLLAKEDMLLSADNTPVSQARAGTIISVHPVNASVIPFDETKSIVEAVEDLAYTHPSKHPVSIIDGSSNPSKFVKTDTLGNTGFDIVTWAEVAGKPNTYTPNSHEHSLDEVTSGTLPASRVAISETRQFITAEQASQLLDMEVKSNKGMPNGYAPLDSNGKINPSFLSDLNLVEVFTPADLASMLALTSAQPGDIAYRQDNSTSYMLVALPASTEANWKSLNTGSQVISVNGQTGVVSLNTSNIAESTNLYFTNERVDDRVANLLQAGTNISLAYDGTSNTLTINANDTSVDWSEVQSKPTTISGYGITDAYTKTETNSALSLKAPLASPTFTGVPSGPTAVTGTSTTQLATTEFVTTGLTNYVNKSGDTMTGNLAITTTSTTASIETSVSAGTTNSRLVTYPQSHASRANTTWLTTQSSSPLILGTSNVERMRIDTAGNVGIGTTSPNSPLVVGTPNTQTAAVNAQFNGLTPTLASGNGHLNIGSTDAAAADKGGVLAFTGNTTTLNGYPLASIAGKYQTVGAGIYSGYLQFNTTDNSGLPTEKARLTSQGNFGLGTNLPLYPLVAYRADTSTTLGASSASMHIVNTDSGAYGRLAELVFNIVNQNVNSELACVSAQYATYGTSYGGNLIFGTNPGTGGSVVERMRILAAGNVSIGSDTVPDAATKLFIKIDTNNHGYSHILNTGNYNSGIRFTNTVSDWYAYARIGTGDLEFYRNIGTGNVLVSSPAGLGYGTGAGGTVTQLTSKNTAVTLNKPCGQITMNNAALAAGTTATFQFNNSIIDASTVVNINAISGAATLALYTIKAVGNYNGGVYISVQNIGTSSLSEALVINFVVIKGATA